MAWKMAERMVVMTVALMVEKLVVYLAEKKVALSAAMWACFQP
jgi:hypothetical protein